MLVQTKRFPFRATIIAALLSLAFFTAGEATYMLAKARLAQFLIERSWISTGNQPWPWADTWPIARLLIPDIKLDSFVLSGATGATLAFGPGMVSGSAAPGENGVTMIAAHRDTHFESLSQISQGSVIRIQNTDKLWHQYRVTGIRIADSRTEFIEPNPADSKMILVTCYPFDALIPGGPLRFVVEAELIIKPAEELSNNLMAELFVSNGSTH